MIFAQKCMNLLRIRNDDHVLFLNINYDMISIIITHSDQKVQVICMSSFQCK